jgi:Methyltransferase domain
MASDDFPISLPRDVAIFEPPTWLVGETPAWIEHIPFAFWVTARSRPSTFVELGTHYGNSYFAFAQSIERNGVECAAYAVDTWEGDDHSGRYGDEVFVAVSNHNGSSYGHFSSLIRSTFDEAQRHFDDGEVDLLHIDGHHSYESVRHDFEMWLPKLSNRAVVLFHDVAVRERDFGVHAVWKEIGERYPTFTFDHSHGLGVAGVGPEQSDDLAVLFDANDDDVVAIKRIFSSLGTAVARDARMRSEVAAAREGFDASLAAEREAHRALIDEERRRCAREIGELRDSHERAIAALELSLGLAEERAAARYAAGLGASPGESGLGAKQ